MGIAIPQLTTEDRASGAQVIDRALKFNAEKEYQHLKRTPSVTGNRRNWTISFWTKRGEMDTGQDQRLVECPGQSMFIRIGSSDQFQYKPGGANGGENTPARKIRDNGGWYHCVFQWDSAEGVDGNRIYINGELLTTNQTGGTPSGDSGWNTSTDEHTIGKNNSNANRFYDGMMSQFYFVDGQTLGPESFGYNDPLTNTWRPKKYEYGQINPNNGTTWSNSLAAAGSDTIQNADYAF